jgi:hypothetical protein
MSVVTYIFMQKKTYIQLKKGYGNVSTRDVGREEAKSATHHFYIQLKK